MTKTIVVAGARSNVGKTTLARRICGLLDDALHVKIGHGEPKPQVEGAFYHHGTPVRPILDDHPERRFVIIESNTALADFTPDMAVYLAADNPKPSAALARDKADIIRGTPVHAETIGRLASSLGCTPHIVRRIAWLAGARPEPVTGIVLAGGKSSRMGTDKALLDIGGRSAAARALDMLAPLTDATLVVASADNRERLGAVRCVTDKAPGMGPLMGLATGLESSHTEINLAVACDIPEIQADLVYRMLAEIDGKDIVVPSFTEGRYEPLLALYRRSLAPAAAGLLAQQKRRVAALFDHGRTCVLRVDDAGWYRNLNTPGDYRDYVNAFSKGACDAAS